MLRSFQKCNATQHHPIGVLQCCTKRGLKQVEYVKFYTKGLVMQKLVALNENGHRINQEHPGAKLTDAEVSVLLELREEGYSYAWLARKFNVSKSCARWICTGRNRNQTPAKYVRVLVK